MSSTFIQLDHESSWIEAEQARVGFPLEDVPKLAKLLDIPWDPDAAEQPPEAKSLNFKSKFWYRQVWAGIGGLADPGLFTDEDDEGDAETEALPELVPFVARDLPLRFATSTPQQIILVMTAKDGLGQVVSPGLIIHAGDPVANPAMVEIEAVNGRLRMQVWVGGDESDVPGKGLPDAQAGAVVCVRFGREGDSASHSKYFCERKGEAGKEEIVRICQRFSDAAHLTWCRYAIDPLPDDFAVDFNLLSFYHEYLTWCRDVGQNLVAELTWDTVPEEESAQELRKNIVHVHPFSSRRLVFALSDAAEDFKPISEFPIYGLRETSGDLCGRIIYEKSDDSHWRVMIFLKVNLSGHTIICNLGFQPVDTGQDVRDVQINLSRTQEFRDDIDGSITRVGDKWYGDIIVPVSYKTIIHVTMDYPNE